MHPRPPSATRRKLFFLLVGPNLRKQRDQEASLCLVPRSVASGYLSAYAEMTDRTSLPAADSHCKGSKLIAPSTGNLIFHEPPLMCPHCRTWVHAKRLDKHMTPSKCPSLRRTQETEALPYFKRGVNTPARLELASAEPWSVPDLVATIRRVHSELLGEEPIADAVMAPEYADVLYERTSKHKSESKHARQNISLSAHIIELLGASTATDVVLVELGAGKALLSQTLCFLSESHERFSGASFRTLLVDRERLKLKAERTGTMQRFHPERVYVDIRDFDLAAAAPTVDGSVVVCYAKHLCGNATDLGLRCMLNHPTCASACLAIAPCCHHRIKPEEYLGYEALRPHFGSSVHLTQLFKASAWSSLNKGSVASSGSASPAEVALSIAEKARIGQQAKEIIDWGRAQYLKAFFPDVAVVYFADFTSTLETRVILARR